jgi:hypothetical protein
MATSHSSVEVESKTASQGVGAEVLLTPAAAKSGDTERGGKVRQLSIPSILDRVFQGALKLQNGAVFA